jgi:hypothetical protein
VHSNNASPQFSTAFKWCTCALLCSLAPSRSPYYIKPKTSQQVAHIYILQLISSISNPSLFLIIFCSMCLSLLANDPGDACFPSRQTTLVTQHSRTPVTPGQHLSITRDVHNKLGHKTTICFRVPYDCFRPYTLLNCTV